MSYQPPGPFPPAVANGPAPSAGSRRSGLLWLGIVALVAGLIGGGVLLASSASMEDDAARDLARAPVNCTTTLHVDAPATFVVFIETTGRLTDLDGGCVDEPRQYTHSASRLPTVDLTLTNGDDEELDLDRRTDVSYDFGGYRGTSVREVTIDQAGDYQLTVLSSADDVAITVGKDPNGAGDSTRTLGLVVLIAGVALGAVLIVLGLRRKAPPTGSPTMAPPFATANYPTTYPMTSATAPPPAMPPMAPGPPGHGPFASPPAPPPPGQWPGAPTN